MRYRILVGVASFALAISLLINFRGPADLALSGAVTGSGLGLGTSPGGTTPSTTGGAGASAPAGGTGAAGTSTAPTAPTAGTGTAARSGQFVGPVTANPFGDVQVQITVQNGKIVDVTALSLPSGGHSGRISQYAGPILQTQALTAQSARIDGVSGATYTSQAYAQSLQGALNQAGM